MYIKFTSYFSHILPCTGRLKFTNHVTHNAQCKFLYCAVQVTEPHTRLEVEAGEAGSTSVEPG